MGLSVRADTPFITQLVVLLPGVSQQQAGASDRISIGPGLPTIPRKLLEKIHRWEYIDLAELLPQTSAPDAPTPVVDPHCFVLFPGCNFIQHKKCNIEAIAEWVEALLFIQLLWEKSSWKQCLRCWHIRASHCECQQTIQWHILMTLSSKRSCNW